MRGRAGGGRHAAGSTAPWPTRRRELSRARIQALMAAGAVSRDGAALTDASAKAPPGLYRDRDPAAGAGRSAARGDPADGAVRGRAPDRGRQAGRHGRASGARQRDRHAGQRPAGPLRRQPLRHRRRGAARHRAPARQGHLRRDGRRQDRRRAPRPRRPVRAARHRAGLPGADPRRAEATRRARSRPGIGRSPRDRKKMAVVTPRRPRGDDPLRGASSATARTRGRSRPASPAGWRPAAPTRSASTSPTSARPAWAIRSTAPARRPRRCGRRWPRPACPPGAARRRARLRPPDHRRGLRFESDLPADLARGCSRRCERL